MKNDGQGIEKYAIESVPTRDWKFTKLLDDIMMVEFVDTNDKNEVKRGLIYVPADASRAVWRVGKVLMAGPKVPDYIVPGESLVMFPNDKGIQSVTREGKHVVFLNVERIFGVVEAQA